jgi:hypothetical protein
VALAGTTGDDNDFLVTVAETVTAAWTPGRYVLSLWVTATINSIAVRKTVYEAPLDMFVNPALATAIPDQRTEASRILAELRRTAAKLAGKELVSATVTGKVYTMLDREKLRDDIRFWENRVAQEQRQANPEVDTVRVRFGTEEPRRPFTWGINPHPRTPATPQKQFPFSNKI